MAAERLFHHARSMFYSNITNKSVCTVPWKFCKFFWRLPLHLKVWGGPGGSGGSEKHIWKIFYRGDPKGPKFLFEKYVVFFPINESMIIALLAGSCPYFINQG